MHHLLGFWTTNLATPSTNVGLGVLTDTVVPVQNNRYQMPWDATILAAYGGGNNAVDLRINAPPFRLISLPYVTPLQAQPIPSNAAPVQNLGSGQLTVGRTNEVLLEASTTGGVAADFGAALWITPGFRSAPVGPIYTVQWTCTPTLVKGAWVLSAINFTQILPAGRWAIVGMEVFGANTMLDRVAFADQVYRPGVLVRNAVGGWIDQTFRAGNFGKFGEFVSYAQPNVEFLGTAAGANAQIGYFDLVQIGPY